jgi:hypothetical protein
MLLRPASQHGDPLILTGFATFGLVFELFIVEKRLFTSCEHKVRATIDAL